MLCSTLYGLTSKSDTYTAAKMAIADRVGKTVSVLAPKTDSTSTMLDYRQLSMSGEELLNKNIEMPGFESGEFDGVHDRLYLMLNEALSGFEGRLREKGWLSVYPVDPANPEAILHEDYYKIIHKIQQQIARDLAVI